MKTSQINAWALILAFVAFTAVQISYISGGLDWLDFLLLLLIPAFILFMISLFQPWHRETKDYCVSLTLIIVCVLFVLFYQSNVEVGTMDDDYHNANIAAFSIKNSVAIKWQYVMQQSDGKFYYLDFIDSIWGIFWRWARRDLIIMVVQALPIMLLWQQLVIFFRKQKASIPGILACLTVMSLAMLWSQVGPTFVDGTVGILGGITLLLCYRVLKYPDERNLSCLAGLAFTSGLCLISKASSIPIGLLGLITALVLTLRHLNLQAKFLVLLSVLPSLLYIFYRQGQIWIKKGSPWYPYIFSTHNGSKFEGWYHYYYNKDPVYSWIRDHAFNFKPFYILASWLMDFRLDSDINPDPCVRGNGLIFTYFVIPTLIFWLIKEHRNIFKRESWKNPALIILAVASIYYLVFDGSIGARFQLSFNILFLAWCLAWLWGRMETFTFKWAAATRITIVCILVFLAAGSYFEGVLGRRLKPRMLSLIQTQREIFPNYVPTEDLEKSIVQLLQTHGAYPPAWRGN